MNRTIVDSLRSLAIFVEVVEQGSFRGAALSLSLAPSRVSETVSTLERSLRVSLLNRSTRSLSLTAEGQALFKQARLMLSAAEHGFDAVGAVSGEPVGDLSVTLPGFLTGGILVDRIASFAQQHPRVELKLHFSDRPSNLIVDQFDVAIRAGFLEYSEDRARSLAHEERLLVVSPDYLGTREQPENPADLADWDWISFMMRPNSFTFTSEAGEECTVSGRSHVAADSIVSVCALALRGLGVTVVNHHLARRWIDKGDLVHLLPAWSLPPLGFHAVWPDKPRRENLVSLFVDFLSQDFAGRESSAAAY